MAELQQTPLHAAHVEAGAKMVDFAGWHMPVQFSGILAEHQAVREQVGIFDVSHMGEIDFEGPGAIAAVQKLMTNDVSRLVDGAALYTVTCRRDGGIVDDCIVYRNGPESLRVVVNASNIDKDEAHFREHAGDMCTIVNRSDQTALIAVQGPHARELVAKLGGADLLELPGFHFGPGEIAGAAVTAARTGYTGEDGFELFVAPDAAPRVWDALLEAGATPCGLGARDTLRLEAKLCLYGNDIDETTTPYEAKLGWVVKLRAGEFVGRDALAAQKQAGVTRSLIGFRVIVEGKRKGSARPGWVILDPDRLGDTPVGEVTSGGPSPTLGGSIGMGYVPKALAKPGTRLALRSKHKTLAAEVVKGPFYKRAQ